MDGMPGGAVTLFLGGDVMTGRGVDQILPHPGDPRLWETHLQDAGAYVALAEERHGPIPYPVDFSWPWGEAVPLLDAMAPDVRMVNLETSITRSDAADPGKLVHYRMAPENAGCLTAAGLDFCALANNHLLDFGQPGLADTPVALAAAGISAAGAGSDLTEASQPAVVSRDGGRRVIVSSCAAASSGVPARWAASGDRPGVNLLPDLSAATADRLAERLRQAKGPMDLAVASIHWGSNWGYGVSGAQVGFAHRLIELGVDVVHGHSSHHPRPVEVHRGKLILYGCGDLVDDYEGISGYEQYRDDLRLLYFASVQPGTGRLLELRMAPMQARQLRLHHACQADAAHLRDVMDRISSDFGVRVDLAPDGLLRLAA